MLDKAEFVATLQKLDEEGVKGLGECLIGTHDALEAVQEAFSTCLARFLVAASALVQGQAEGAL